MSLHIGFLLWLRRYLRLCCSCAVCCSLRICQGLLLCLNCGLHGNSLRVQIRQDSRCVRLSGCDGNAKRLCTIAIQRLLSYLASTGRDWPLFLLQSISRAAGQCPGVLLLSQRACGCIT